MGLVDYSNSESDSEPPQKPDPRSTADSSSKKSSSNPIARSATGRILVNLPTIAAPDSASPKSDEPPAKRARLGGGAGSSRFSNFGSFLPPPKVTKAPVAQAAKGSAPRPGIHLKTGAEPAFSRESYSTGEHDDALDGGARSGLNLPPPKANSGPSIPEGQKPEEEVKLVGKPLMFKPLSVARKPNKKKRIIPGAVPKQPVAVEHSLAAAAPGVTKYTPELVVKKKVSLFSMDDESPSAAPVPTSTGTYQPLFGQEEEREDEDAGLTGPYPSEQQGISYAQAHNHQQPLPTHSNPQSLSSIADDLNLSKKARRELFGRDGPGGGGAKIVNFNMEREYAHNEAVRASGEQQAYNPVRAMTSGKHNLRQLVNAAQTNQSALEDTFAANRSSKRDAGARYGWG